MSHETVSSDGDVFDGHLTSFAELGNTTDSSITFPTSNDSSSSNSFQSGAAFYFFASGAEAASNHSYLQAAGQQLRVLILTGAANQIVCQKVNMTDVSTTSAAPGGAAPWYGLAASFGLMVLFS